MQRFLLYFLACATVGGVVWTGHTFGNPSIDQVLYHWHYSERTAWNMSRLFLVTFCAEVIVFPLLVAAAVLIAHALLARLRHPVLHWPLRVAPGAAVLVGVGALLLKFSAFTWAGSYFGQDAFAQAYVPPATVKLHAGPLRNLVLIYAESLEESYADREVFGRDLLLPLHGAGGQRLASYLPAPGTQWTMAAMVATQCALPLRIYSESDLHAEAGGRVFLPGAVCLGDVLAAQGYHNVFMGGVPLSFAGKGAFLRDHGYAERYGREEWRGERRLRWDEVNEWGLYDAALFARARARLEQLHATGHPFNLTLLTLNTHNPRGFLSPACRREGAADFQGIVHCSSEQIADFIEFARSKGFLRDTVVLVLGDHLAVPNPVWDKLNRVPERHMFNLLVADPPARPNTSQMLPFDLFPTLLEVLGIEVQGDRLGLGYSAVNEAHVPRPPMAERLRASELAGSRVYDRLWAPSGGASQALQERGGGIPAHEGDRQ